MAADDAIPVIAGTAHYQVKYRRESWKGAKTRRVKTLDEALAFVANVGPGGPWADGRGVVKVLERCDFLQISFVEADDPDLPDEDD